MHNDSPSFLRIGEYYRFFDEVESTNELLWQMISRGEVPIGGAIAAGYQWAGRGQSGSHWQSEHDANILCSIFIKPHFVDASAQFQLNMAVSLGVSDFGLLYLGEGVQLKWPNDLYYKNRKWGGLLIENTVQGNQIAESVIGIGLNINQAFFSTELNRVTSFTNITGHFYRIGDLLPILFNCLQKRFDELLAGKQLQQRATYLERLLGLGELRTFEINNQLLQATIQNVDEDGRLILDSKMGRLVMNNKEIQFRFDG